MLALGGTLGAVAVFSVVWWALVNRLADADVTAPLEARLHAAEDEGRAFGFSHTAQQCVVEAVKGRDMWTPVPFLHGCLATAGGIDELCVGVPHTDEEGVSYRWRVDRCSAIGEATSFKCVARVMNKVMWSCSWRSDKAKREAEWAAEDAATSTTAAP